MGANLNGSLDPGNPFGSSLCRRLWTSAQSQMALGVGLAVSEALSFRSLRTPAMFLAVPEGGETWERA